MDSSEIEGELEMLSAMYSDAMTITKTDLDNLHRLDSSEVTQQMSSPSTSNSPNFKNNNNQNDERTILNLRLRKNVEIELTFPSQGYYSSSSASPSSLNSKKVRLDVLNTPSSMDGEKLLQIMKKVVKEHTVGEGSLLITICQTAEQYVDGVEFEQQNSSSSNPAANIDVDDEEYYSGFGEDDDEEKGVGMMMMAKTNSNNNSKMMMTANSSNDFFPLSDNSDTAILAELAKRKCLRGSNPVCDKGSKFLAHIAPISSEREAKEIVALLREVKNIASACHPSIYAYRYTNPQTKVVHYDCDDDGEKNGAKSILFVMEQMKVDGYICVCTRYFGGTLLGPIRFKYISQVTRSVIEEAKAGSINSK